MPIVLPVVAVASKCPGGTARTRVIDRQADCRAGGGSRLKNSTGAAGTGVISRHAGRLARRRSRKGSDSNIDGAVANSLRGRS